jgi:hypothetical protein
MTTPEHSFSPGDRVWTVLPDCTSKWNGLFGTITRLLGDTGQVCVMFDDPPGFIGRTPPDGWMYWADYLQPAPDLADPGQVEAFLNNTSIGGTDGRQISYGDPR